MIFLANEYSPVLILCLTLSSRTDKTFAVSACCLSIARRIPAAFASHSLLALSNPVRASYSEAFARAASTFSRLGGGGRGHGMGELGLNKMGIEAGYRG